jgi:hypothetical protein
MLLFRQFKMFFYSYLSCNSIENSNDAGQTTAESNANQACQNNTEDGKEHVKCQKDNGQPVKVQKQIIPFSLYKQTLQNSSYNLSNRKNRTAHFGHP